MAQWYVKDLSKITQVFVQTRHHYDRIGLLKPSIRLRNNYRLYSEKNLLRLQQIKNKVNGGRKKRKPTRVSSINS